MTLTSLVVIIAAVAWIGLRTTAGPTRLHWRSQEYWLALAMFGFSGVGMILGIAGQSDNPAVLGLRFGPLVAIAIVVTIGNLAKGAVIRPAGLLLAAFFLLTFAFSVTENQLLMPLTSLCVLLPAIIIPSRGYSSEALHAGLRDSIRVALVFLAILTLATPGQIIGICRSDKCSLWGLALGPLGTGNAFGMYLALAAGVAVVLARNRLTVLATVAASGLLVDASSGRAAMLSWSFAVAAAGIWRLTRSSRGKRLLSWFCAASASSVLIVGLGSWRPDDFTGRANLWIVARELFSSSPIFGYGPSFWVRQDRTSYVDSNYATHNLLWELLISAGFLGLVLIVLSLAMLLKNADSKMRGVTLVFTSSWLASCILEVTAAPGRLYLIPGALLLIYVYGQARPREGDFSEGSDTSRSLIHQPRGARNSRSHF